MNRLFRFDRRALVVAGTAAAIGLVLPSALGWAQEKFPSKTIEVISHASPGGGTDTTARMMMIRARRYLKKEAGDNAGDVDMVVTYQRGGGAAKAHRYFKAQPADGYTIMALTQTHLYTIARGNSPITIDDIVGVARAMDDPTFIVVHKDSPYKTLEELIEASKKKPLNWGVAQIGSTEHIGLARFATAVGPDFKFKAVTFGSGGKSMAALMSGAIDATLPNVSESLEQVADGSVRPLVVLQEKRLADYPDIPSSYEKGYPIRVTTTRGYGVRKGTPPERIKILEKALVKAMKHKLFATYLRSSGLNPDESVAGSAVWDNHLKEEYKIADEAINQLGLGKK
ncbi:MAG: Bug family tripartite tricarboxylate transporter substrate binding protein [Kiloniellaceae bacterium]